MPSVRTQSEDYRMRRTSSQILRDREQGDYHALENADDVSEISDLEDRHPKPLCGGRLSYFQLGFIVLITLGLILLILYLLTPVFARPIGNKGTVEFTNLRVFDTGEEVQVSSDIQVKNEAKTGATIHDAVFKLKSNDQILGEFPVAQFSFPSRETSEIELNGVVLSVTNSPDFFRNVLTEESVDLQLEASVKMTLGGLILPYDVPFSVRESHQAINNFNGGVRSSVAFNTDDDGQLFLTLQADFENPSDIELALDAIDLELSAAGAPITTVTVPQLVLAPNTEGTVNSLSSFELTGQIDTASDGLSNLMAMAFSGAVVDPGSFVGTVQPTTLSSQFLEGIPFDFGDLYLKREEVGNGDTDVSIQDVGPMFTGAAFRVRPLDLVNGAVPEEVDFGLQIFNPFNSPVTIESVSFDISIGDKPETPGAPLDNEEPLGKFVVNEPFEMTASSVEAGQAFVSGTLQLTDASNDRVDRIVNNNESFGMAIAGSMTVSISSDVTSDMDIEVTMPTFSCADSDSVSDAGAIGGEFLGLSGVNTFCVAEVPVVSIEGTCEYINITNDDVNNEICADEYDSCLLAPGCRHMVEDTSAQCDFPNDALPGPVFCWLEKNGLGLGTEAYLRYALMVECVQNICQDPELAVLTAPTTAPPTASPTPTPTEEPCPISEDDLRVTCADEFAACEADNPCRNVIDQENVCVVPEQLLDGGASCFLRGGLNLGSSSFTLMQDVAQCVIDACDAAEA